jgi:hypothetical protein
MRCESLSLFRQLLRALDAAPSPKLRQKMRFNIRELFELRRHESDPARIASIVKGGQEDLDTMRRVFGTADRQTLHSLFWDHEIDPQLRILPGCVEHESLSK